MKDLNELDTGGRVHVVDEVLHNAMKHPTLTMTTLEERFNSEFNLVELDDSGNDKGKATVLVEMNGRVLDFIRQELKSTLEECVEMGEDLKPSRPYPNASNNYQKELDEEGKIVEKTISDYQSKLREKIKLLE